MYAAKVFEREVKSSDPGLLAISKDIGSASMTRSFQMSRAPGGVTDVILAQSSRSYWDILIHGFSH